MAKVIPFDQLEEGKTYYEEFCAGTAFIPCTVVSRENGTRVTMKYGKVCPWTQETKEDTQFRYWDGIPAGVEDAAESTDE